AVVRSDGSNEVFVRCQGEGFYITSHDAEILGLTEGERIDEETFNALNEARERLLCIKKAFDHLSYGDLSKRQLRDKLRKKFPPRLCEDVAELFAERGYINDARLAERYAETFYEFKNMGLGKIREQLFRRGISREDIDNALSKYENENQYDRIREFINKKYDPERFGDEKYRRKVYAGAVRAGFSGSDVADVLRNYESDW
ncbi:MAG: RecX family transcriptional regulator, partial [Clostridia bacterium]|nr:RecX family transcriptional regulator [Clostridia bacterium]